MVPDSGHSVQGDQPRALVTILRDGQVYVPDPEQPIESGDELLFVVPAEKEDELERLLAPSSHGG